MVVEVNSFIDLDKIYLSGQCFRWEKYPRGVYVIPHKEYVLKVRQLDYYTLEVDCTEEYWESVWKDYFDEASDYACYEGSIDERDSYLREAAKYSRGMRILKQDIWETLISFIISQNNNIPRIKKIIANLVTVYGGFPTADNILSHPDLLDDVGLGYRKGYLIEAAKRYKKEGGIHAKDYDSAMNELLQYRGVGEKVANCVCLFGLGYKEAFPIDTWISKILHEHYDGRFPVTKYYGYAGVLQQYMFYYERYLAGKL